jgi:hypothetical protein
MATNCGSPLRVIFKSSRGHPIAGCATVLVALATLWPHLLAAQTAERPIDEIRVGDAWVYDRRDDLTGYPMNTFTSLVTEVSPQEIVTSAIFRGNSGRGLVVFDHDWNRTIDNMVKYKPNDAHGVHLPLAVGKQWRVEYTSSNSQNGVNMKATGLSKVVGEEMLTTDAGTFDTFKIDRETREFNTADPSKLWEVQMLMWFAPSINHWVRRSVVMKFEKRVRTSSTDELIDVIKKP